MTTHLTARHIAGRNGQPLAEVNGLPGLDALMTVQQLGDLSRQLKQIKNDAQSGVRGMRRYPEDEEQSNEY
ncbi:MAG: hypothetical protein VX946_07155 [Pseudomonadota bacterium]|nr:hypothetical protein [Pseudomonadota bacterium]